MGHDAGRKITPDRIGEVTWEIGRDFRPDMHVPVRVLADEELLSRMLGDRSFEQLINVATLPGITRFAIGMPDMHQGYGFPVGGVAATIAPDGVISPGGIGFDINCGVRLLAANVTGKDIKGRVKELVDAFARAVPTGYGKGGRLSLEPKELDQVLRHGARHVVTAHGLGTPDDLQFLESNGCLPDADPSLVSDRAKQRARDQLGTLGGGNHFLEIQVVEQVFDEAAAAAVGVELGQVTILIHTGSRGLGHQVCTDHVREMDSALARHGIVLPDRQLACAPLSSREGRNYFAAMCAAANFAWANRQALTHWVREAFGRVLGAEHGKAVRVVYDVAHNIAKLEEQGGRKLCIHRKGATRAFGPGSAEIPPRYRGVGQPVFIPGSMGTASHVLVGTAQSQDISLGSACHGAGRAMSRTAAKAQVKGAELRRQLEKQGIVVRCGSDSELAEEAPVAYKDVDRVVNVIAAAGVARKVARLVPVGVLKG